MGMKDMDPDCVGPFGPCKIVEQEDRGSMSHGIHCVGPPGLSSQECVPSGLSS